VKPVAFEYVAARSVEEALAALARERQEKAATGTTGEGANGANEANIAVGGKAKPRATTLDAEDLDPFEDDDVAMGESDTKDFEAKIDARLAERKQKLLEAHEAAKKAKTCP
jgi:hypothetical protein